MMVTGEDRRELKARYRAKREAARAADERNEYFERLENRYLYSKIDKETGGGNGSTLEAQAMARIRFNQKGADRLIIPDNNIFADHLSDIQNPKLGLAYSPKNYPDFDKVIANTFLSDEFRYQNHPNHEKYQPLRENIAVLRNFVYGRMFPDGSFDENDASKAPMLAEMANAIGVALTRDAVMMKRPFSYSIDIDAANTPGIGAAEMYKLLLKIQNEHSVSSFLARPLDYILHPIDMLRGRLKKAWNLPPIEETPFSVAALTTPAQGHRHVENGQTIDPTIHAQIVADKAAAHAAATEAGSMLWERLADEMELRARRLQSVASLNQPVLDESVEIAHDILKRLKVTLSSESARDWLNVNPDDKLDDVEDILESTEAYEKYLATAMRADPGIINSKEVQEANLAMGKLAFIIKSHAIERCKAAKNLSTAEELKFEVTAMPDEWRNIGNVSIKDLVGKIEAGYNVARSTVKSSPQYQQAPVTAQPPKTRQLNDVLKKAQPADVALLKQAVDNKGQPIKSNLARPALDPKLLQNQEGRNRG